MKVFLINLDRSKDRLISITESLNHLSIPFDRVSAVDANKISSEELYSCVHSPSLNYPRVLTRGEIACFKSHQICWQKLVDSNDDWAIILEDNCEFAKTSKKYLSSLDWIPSNCELIHLSYTVNKLFYQDEIKLQDNNSLIRTECSSPMGTSAYVISRNAAQRALELSQTISEPVDNFLFGMFSDFAKEIPCWRTKVCAIRRADVTTVITGRVREKSAAKHSSLIAFHPLRLLKKIRISIRHHQLRKTQQIWENK